MEKLPSLFEPSSGMQAPQQSTLRWADIGRFLRRYALVILIVFSTTVLGTYATLSLLTEQYDTSAEILVKMGRENLDPPPTVRNQNVLAAGLRREEVMSEIQLLSSRSIVEAAVNEIGLEAFKDKRTVPPDLLGRIKFYTKAAIRTVKDQYKETLYALNLSKRLSDQEAAVAEVSEKLGVVYQKDTDVIALQLRMASPELARRLLNSVLSHYMISRIQVRQTGNINEFFDEESTRLRSSLAASERELAEWKLKHQLSSTHDQKAALIQQINGLVGDRDSTDREIRSLRQEIETSKSITARAPETVRMSRQEVSNPSLDALKQRLVTLQSEQAKLLSKFPADSPTVFANTSEIARIKDLINAEAGTRTGSETIQINPVRQDLIKAQETNQIRLAGLESKAAVQAKQITSLRSELERLETADLRLSQLERQKQIDEAQYVGTLRRRQEAEVSKKLDLSRISNVTIISPPASTFEPVYPRKLFMMGIALALGLVLGVGLSLLLAYMDDTVYDERQLEAVLGLPCLGTVTATGSAISPT
jgi:uncharacterized protein involved in exopolysaccharide biosynthesis